MKRKGILGLSMMIIFLGLFKISAEQVCQAQDMTLKRTEIFSRRTLTSKHFKNEDGTYTGVFYASPVHYLDEEGQWQEIDLNPRPIREIAQARMKRFGVIQGIRDSKGQEKHPRMDMRVDDRGIRAEPNDFSYGVVTNNFGTFFPRKLDKPICISLSAEAQVFILPLDGREGQTKQQLQGREYVYSNFWPYTSLRYRVTPNGVKESIILDSAAAPSTYRFFLALRGCEARLTMDGRVEIVSGDTILASIMRPWVQDGAGEEGPEVVVDLIPAENGYVFTLSINETWLRNSKRVFPLEIDPSIFISLPTMDTYINKQHPDSAYGDSVSLCLGNWHSWLSGFHPHRILIKFDLSNLSRQTLLHQAKLRMFCYSITESGTNDVEIYPAISDWSENSTWNTAYSNIDWNNRLGRVTLPGGAMSWHEFPIDTSKHRWLRSPHTLGKILRSKRCHHSVCNQSKNHDCQREQSSQGFLICTHPKSQLKSLL